eukprot:gene388-biopygen353
MGYDAGYYGYMWSKVFALDVFDYIRSHNGLLDPKVGHKYASSILGLAGRPNESLKEFLGRDPSNAAFLKILVCSLLQHMKQQEGIQYTKSYRYIIP